MVLGLFFNLKYIMYIRSADNIQLFGWNLHYSCCSDSICFIHCSGLSVILNDVITFILLCAMIKFV